MSKEWHENIPENGVLCKHEDGRIVLLKVVDNDWGYGLSPANGYYLADLTPLTADEFWGVAPWQDMKTAPIEGKFMIRVKWISEETGNTGHMFCMAWRSDISKSGFMRDGLVPLYEPFEWLSLPFGEKD